MITHLVQHVGDFRIRLIEPRTSVFVVAVDNGKFYKLYCTHKDDEGATIQVTDLALGKEMFAEAVAVVRKMANNPTHPAWRKSA